jgi:hypothetical protein
MRQPQEWERRYAIKRFKKFLYVPLLCFPLPLLFLLPALLFSKRLLLGCLFLLPLPLLSFACSLFGCFFQFPLPLPLPLLCCCFALLLRLLQPLLLLLELLPRCKTLVNCVLLFTLEWLLMLLLLLVVVLVVLLLLCRDRCPPLLPLLLQTMLLLPPAITKGLLRRRRRLRRQHWTWWVAVWHSRSRLCYLQWLLLCHLQQHQLRLLLLGYWQHD